LSSRPYQLFVLSDHGQAFGPTFRQRYKTTLRDLVDHLTKPDISVHEAHTSEDKLTYASALVNELAAADRQLATQPNTRFRRAVMRQAARTLERSATNTIQHPVVSQPQIIVCVSGNLANIYFDIGEDKVRLSDIERTHPGLVSELIQHAGIGFITAYADSGEAIVLGKHGARNLCTGALTGEDPLMPYGDAEKCSAQLLRISEFHNSGDLILNSTVYSDGTVASFEDLIGVHGGLGGQQTDAFILHPVEVGIDGKGILNATQVFQLLDRQRSSDNPCTDSGGEKDETIRLRHQSET
jgi:hypothetical protein